MQDAVFKGLDFAYRGPLLFIVLALLVIIIAAFAWFALKVWPQQEKNKELERLQRIADKEAERLERAKDREHVEAMVKRRGEEAAEDASRDRELAKAQTDAVVTRIEIKISDSHSILRRLAEKAGVILLWAMITFSTGSLLLVSMLEIHGALAQKAAPKCDPPCPAGYRCASENNCKPINVATNKSVQPVKPSSMSDENDTFLFGFVEYATPPDPWGRWDG
jgi:Na+-transporting methylmalonyl-CoA/oxaloacetate decarboxylase gamma subunit